MKSTVLALFILLASVVSLAQEPKRIALTPKSTVPLALLAENMDKKCSGVVLTRDASKADFLLEADVLQTMYKGTTNSKTEYTLFNSSGDLLFHTSTRYYKNAMKDVCNYIGVGKKK